MKKNMGTLDKIIRLIISAVIVILFMTKTISGTTGIILISLAAIFTLTSIVSSCPLYLPFGITTRPNKK